MSNVIRLSEIQPENLSISRNQFVENKTNKGKTAYIQYNKTSFLVQLPIIELTSSKPMLSFTDDKTGQVSYTSYFRFNDEINEKLTDCFDTIADQLVKVLEAEQSSSKKKGSKSFSRDMFKYPLKESDSEDFPGLSYSCRFNYDERNGNFYCKATDKNDNQLPFNINNYDNIFKKGAKLVFVFYLVGYSTALQTGISMKPMSFKVLKKGTNSPTVKILQGPEELAAIEEDDEEDNANEESHKKSDDSDSETESV